MQLKKLKKGLAVLLSSAMVMGMMPVMAFAASEYGEDFLDVFEDELEEEGNTYTITDDINLAGDVYIDGTVEAITINFNDSGSSYSINLGSSTLTILGDVTFKGFVDSNAGSSLSDIAIKIPVGSANLNIIDAKVKFEDNEVKHVLGARNISGDDWANVTITNSTVTAENNTVSQVFWGLDLNLDNSTLNITDNSGTALNAHLTASDSTINITNNTQHGFTGTLSLKEDSKMTVEDNGQIKVNGNPTNGVNLTGDSTISDSTLVIVNNGIDSEGKDVVLPSGTTMEDVFTVTGDSTFTVDGKDPLYDSKRKEIVEGLKVYVANEVITAQTSEDNLAALTELVAEVEIDTELVSGEEYYTVEISLPTGVSTQPIRKLAHFGATSTVALYAPIPDYDVVSATKVLTFDNVEDLGAVTKADLDNSTEDVSKLGLLEVDPGSTDANVKYIAVLFDDGDTEVIERYAITITNTDYVEGFLVTVEVSGQGTVDTKKAIVAKGNDFEIKAEGANKYYKVSKITVNGELQTGTTVKNIQQDTQIVVTFSYNADGDSSSSSSGGSGGRTASVDASTSLGQNNNTENNNGGTTTTPSTPAGFVDVPAGSWFYDAVTFVTENGLFYGVSNSEFAPNTNMTRAMFVTVLGRVAEDLGLTTSGYSNTFADVAGGQWYSDYISWASANGIVNGYNNDEFGVNDNVTREQMAVILIQFADYARINLNTSSSKTFTDESAISAWASDAVAKAASAGLINGYEDGSFKPQSTATRAEVASVFRSFVTTYGDADAVVPAPVVDEDEDAEEEIDEDVENEDVEDEDEAGDEE